MLKTSPIPSLEDEPPFVGPDLADRTDDPHLTDDDPALRPSDPMMDNPSFDGHERVLFAHDADTGLQAIVAIHSTVLGPAAGGCRLWSYETYDLALTDALRLSQGMSFKNAMAELPLGGGKAVILGPIDEDRREAVFEAFGRIVESLNGDYITAEDVGVSVDDMVAVQKSTRYVSGIGGNGSIGGDPSPFTARGVARGIEAMAGEVLQRSDLEGLRVAIQGVGSVGLNLCRELTRRGARIRVADIKQESVERACDLYGAEPTDLDTVLFEAVDIVSPCALGGVIDVEAAGRISAPIVAGAANNQLATPEAGQALFDRNIAYAPDYVINAGGIIAVAAEYLNNQSQDEMTAAVDKVFDRVRNIQQRSAKQGEAPQIVADALAKSAIRQASQG